MTISERTERRLAEIRARAESAAARDAGAPGIPGARASRRSRSGRRDEARVGSVTHAAGVELRRVECPGCERGIPVAVTETRGWCTVCREYFDAGMTG